LGYINKILKKLTHHIFEFSIPRFHLGNIKNTKKFNNFISTKI